MPPTALAASPDPLVIGRYRPLRPLGSGGSGAVWLARDEKNGLDVALKIVAREGKAAARAEREARAAAALRHPRCLRAYALARDPSHVYIAYEYVPGRTLREAMRAGQLNDREAVEAAAQILEGLAHAHASGIVHRDVKPSNVLLAECDAVDVRLLDFGLALVHEAETLTNVGDVPGTLAYISPERLDGGQGGPSADVWAVGVLLWEALTGVHPFWCGSLQDTARTIREGLPPIEPHRPDLPEGLRRAIATAGAVDPTLRPPAGRLAAELRGVAHRRRRARTRISAPSRPSAAELVPRLAPAGLAAVAAGWSASALPFYPAGWPGALAAVAGAATLARERLGLVVALAVPFFPLANLALGAALLYAVVAAVWLALAWREPRTGLFVVLGPLVSPLAALGLLPLVAQVVRSRARRVVQVGAAVLLAALVAGLRHVALPFTGDPAPLGLGIAGSDRPTAVASALWQALADRPALLLEALVLAAAAAAIPRVRRRGPWPAALFGAGLASATLLVAPTASALPLVLATWLTCAVLVLEPHLAASARRGRPSGRAREGARYTRAG
jgi:Protein kinase domain